MKRVDPTSTINVAKLSSVYLATCSKVIKNKILHETKVNENWMWNKQDDTSW